MTYLTSDLLARLPREIIRSYAKDSVTRITVGAVLQRQLTAETEILILRRVATDEYGGIEELPSGEVESGETLGEAIAREVFEETGVIVKEIGAFLFDFIYLSHRGVTAQLNFLVDTSANPLVRVDRREHDSFRWLSFSSLTGSALSPQVARGVSLALSARYDLSSGNRLAVPEN